VSVAVSSKGGKGTREAMLPKDRERVRRNLSGCKERLEAKVVERWQERTRDQRDE